MNHSVSLKVLRLSQPGSQSGVLLLPVGFGTLYQQEHFTALVALSLDSAETDSDHLHDHHVINPRLTLELQSPSNRNTHITTLHAPALHSDSTELHSIIHHQIHELGLHSLVCTVSYEEPGLILEHDPSQPELHDSQIRSFRKLYKFQVLCPLSIKIRVLTFVHLDHQEDAHSQTDKQAGKLVEILGKLLAIKECGEDESGTDMEMDKGNQERILEKLKTHLSHICPTTHFAPSYLEISVQNQTLKPLTLRLSIVDSISKNHFRLTNFSCLLSPSGKPEPINYNPHAFDACVLPGNVYQYSFKIDPDLGMVKAEDLRNKNDEEGLKLQVDFIGEMGESGRMVKDLGAATRWNGQVQASPSPSSGLRMDQVVQEGVPRGGRGTNGLFQFEVCGLPGMGRVGSRVELRVRIAVVEVVANDDGSIRPLLRALLASHLSALHLHPSTHILSPQPLCPSLRSPDALEFSITFLAAPHPPGSPLLHLGTLSAGNPHLDALFCLPKSSLGFLFCSP